MAERRLAQELDECIDRVILGGESVEGCLERYPEHAVELEAPLRLAVRSARIYAFTLSPAAEERGRQRIQAELRRLEEQDAVRTAWPAPWLRTLFGQSLRWGVGTLVALLLVLSGSAGAVAALFGALPGHELYPVKRAIEDARVALEFSQEGKAELHLALAERRAQEITSLLKEGDTSHLESTDRALRDHITQAARIAGDLEDDAAARLGAKLQTDSSRVLADLQTAWQVAPEGSRQVAGESYRTAAEAYGNAIDEATRRPAAPPSAALPGTLQLFATATPPPGVEKVLVEVGEIEAHLAAGGESRWITVTGEPQTLDLLRPADLRRFLGSQSVPPGAYTALRFPVTGVIVVADGEEYQAGAPDERINLVRPFRVEEGHTTTVVLDFDGAGSLEVAGSGHYTLAPRVMVRAAEPRLDQKPEAKQDERDQEKGPRGEPTRSRVDVGGSIEALQTKKGVATPGAAVEVEGIQQPDDTIPVARVTLVPARPAAEPTPALAPTVAPRPHSTPTPEPTRIPLLAPTTVGLEAVVEIPTPTFTVTPRPQPQPTSTPTPEPTRTSAPVPAPVQLEGLVEVIQGLEWRVEGTAIQVTAETRIEGAPVVGSRVRVSAVRQADGAILAGQIELVGGRQEGQPTPTPTLTVTPRPQPQPTRTLESTRASTPTPQPSRTPTPMATPVQPVPSLPVPPIPSLQPPPVPIPSLPIPTVPLPLP